MAQEIDSRLGSKGTAAMVRLSDDTKSIASVIVTLASPSDEQREKQEDEADDSAIQPVDIAVSVTVDEVASTSGSSHDDNEKDEEQAVVTAEQKTVIEQALRQGWGVAPKQIQIRTD
jgi:dsDNA-binding SOS-regulon protein